MVFFILILFVLVFYLWRTLGVMHPLTIHVGYSVGCMAMFEITQVFGLVKSDFMFTAMPINDFSDVRWQVFAYYTSIIFVGLLAGYSARSFASNRVVVDFHFLDVFSNKGRSFEVVPMALLVMMCFAHFFDIDRNVLFINYEYLLVKDPGRVGLDFEITRVFHNLLKLLGLVFSVLMLHFYYEKKYAQSFLSAIIFLYAAFLMLAGESRWVPLYFAAMVLYLHYRNGSQSLKVFFLICLVLTFIYVLESRNRYAHGLSQFFPVIYDIGDIGFFSSMAGLLVNIFEGAFNYANTILIWPEFDSRYKLLSFSPFFSFIDGFDLIRDDLKYKFAPNVPMSAYSEVYFFGGLYLVAFFLLLFVFIYAVSVAMRRNVEFGLYLSVPSIYILMSLHTYSLRTSFRYMLALIVISFVFSRFGNNLKRLNNIKGS